MPLELQFHGDGTARIAEQPFPSTSERQVEVEALISGVSGGTELRHFMAAEPGRIVRPGYEFVGRVVKADGDKDLLGAHTWLDRPHATAVLAPPAEVRAGLLPSDNRIPLSRFSFLARTRTALNAIHDSEMKLGDRVMVIGLGAVGALVTRLAVLAGSSEVLACDPLASRRALAQRWGAKTIEPEEAEGLESHVDIVFEVSGNPAGLALALAICGDHSRIVVVSTYSAQAELPLKKARAVNQPTLLFSTTRPGTRCRGEPSWTHQRLLEQARRLLEDGDVLAEELISQTIPFKQADSAYRNLANPSVDQLSVALDYR